jgi:hypothetical protein
MGNFDNFLVMYHCYQTHYKIHNNINTHVHVRKKTMLVVDFITYCFLCVKQKN